MGFHVLGTLLHQVPVSCGRLPPAALELIQRARELTGEKSNRAVLDLALRRLIASKQKGAMIDGIAELADLPAEFGSPVRRPGVSAEQ